MTNPDLALMFFLQLAVILVSCRVVGWLAGYFSQPQVVAEMIAGVCLGPSLLGLWLPDLQQAIFPWDATQTSRDSQSFLYPVSQLGLAIYMFVVGMEFRLDIVRKNLQCSIAISAAGMIAPFVLGAMLAYWLVDHTSLFTAKTTRWEAMLFMGASLCITAFPMLARIIVSKSLVGTKMGTVAIGAGAIDDAAAWCFLAVVLASFEGDPRLAVSSIGGGVAFVMVVYGLVRPILRWLLSRCVDEQARVSDVGVVLALTGMALGAWFTERIHLHAVFGAFVMGTVIPRGVVTQQLTERIEPLTIAILLPLFFTYSGLNTQINVLDRPSLWAICGIVFLVAVLGKGVACAVAAWLTGIEPREAIGVGVLMNARGLMELIVINIGLQRGVISEQLFAILVLMAIATTLMTSPLFDWLITTSRRHPSHENSA